MSFQHSKVNVNVIKRRRGFCTHHPPMIYKVIFCSILQANCVKFFKSKETVMFLSVTLSPSRF